MRRLLVVVVALSCLTGFMGQDGGDVEEKTKADIALAGFLLRGV